MKEFLLIIAVFIFLGYVFYRMYLGYIILTSKRKYNKSSKIVEWSINNDPIRRFFLFGTFKSIKVEKYKYKILKEEADVDEA